MRRAARAIIIKDDKLLVMHRNKFGRVYDTLPGGNIGGGESPEQALKRELLDETSITFKDPKLVIVHHAGDPYGDQLIYLCTYVSGEAKLQENSEEFLISNMGKNLYEPGWVLLKDLHTRPFVTEKLRDTILAHYHHQWPDIPVEIAG